MLIAWKIGGLSNPIRLFWGPILVICFSLPILSTSVAWFLFVAPFSGFLTQQVRLTLEGPEELENGASGAGVQEWKSEGRSGHSKQGVRFAPGCRSTSYGQWRSRDSTAP